MRTIMILVLIFTGVLYGQDMIVRVYAPDWQSLKPISEKYDLDIASSKRGDWYDIVADQNMLDRIKQSGLAYEITVPSLSLLKEEVRASYLSYEETKDSLEQLVQNYPSICKFDSLPITTMQGNWMYGIKISDNPHLEEDDEPGVLIDGLHHAREWACIPVILFFADSMLQAYGSDPEITEIINTTEMYIFPIINADGYLYDYPAGNMWRKNREPFGGSIGTDCNRNYGGCSPDIVGDWGAASTGGTTHNPSSSTFCGAYAYSGDEVRSLTMFVRSHTINAYMSYHSSGEVIMWGWGWTFDTMPDNSLHVQVGTHMAGLVNSLYSGTYEAAQLPVGLNYPLSGTSLDWFYSWCHWVGGFSNLSFTTELGTQFYQPQNNLDDMCFENFKAMKYLAGFADSIILLTDGIVPPPDIYPLDTVPPNFTIAWHAKHTDDNHPIAWELVELTNPSVIEDDLESGTDRWLLNGYSLSTTQAHSGTHSFFSGDANNIDHAAQTAHPYLVQEGDSITFWCYYNLENNYDVSVAEISENTKEWFNLDTMRINGNSGGWVRYAFPLADWVGRSVYFRFRTMYDNGVTSGGFYVDDISPVCLFADVTTISSTITDTTYDFTSHDTGEYYYYVRGENTMWGWGDYSCLEQIVVDATAIAENGSTTLLTPMLKVSPTVFSEHVTIEFVLGNQQSTAPAVVEIYNAAGMLVRQISLTHDNVPTPGRIIWDGKDTRGRMLTNGVYFVKLSSAGRTFTNKIIKLK
jgi:hypothetical protein